MGVGFVLFFLNLPLLKLPLNTATLFYILTTGLGYIALMIAGVWMNRLLRTNLMDDVFNNENESFHQETKLMVFFSAMTANAVKIAKKREKKESPPLDKAA